MSLKRRKIVLIILTAGVLAGVGLVWDASTGLAFSAGVMFGFYVMERVIKLEAEGDG